MDMFGDGFLLVIFPTQRYPRRGNRIYRGYDDGFTPQLLGLPHPERNGNPKVRQSWRTLPEREAPRFESGAFT